MLSWKMPVSRPWLQDFTHHTGRYMLSTARPVQEQIDAVIESGTNEYFGMHRTPARGVITNSTLIAKNSTSAGVEFCFI